MCIRDRRRTAREYGVDFCEENVVSCKCGLTNLINIFQPEIICIGGGVSKEGDTLLAPVQAVVCLLYTSGTLYDIATVDFSSELKPV